MIYDFINEICDILNIPVPSVSFENAKFQTDAINKRIKEIVKAGI